MEASQEKGTIMKMPLIWAVAAALALGAAIHAPGALAQSQGVVVKPSAFSVKQTMDRLETVLKGKGFQIFARVDHAAGAARIEKEMAPAEVLIFGNPRIATPLMQANMDAGLDLPMKALAYQDASGKVFLVYNHPAYIARRHVIVSLNKLVQAVSRILTNLTDDAIKSQ